MSTARPDHHASFVPLRAPFLALLLAFLCVGVEAASTLPGAARAPQDFLPVDEAFRLGVDLGAAEPRVFWQLEPGYYLYRHRLEFALERSGGRALVDARIPDGKRKNDE